VSKETTINASARMVHIEIEGDDAFVASVAGAVSGIISRLTNREPEPAPKATKKRATKKAAAKKAEPEHGRNFVGAMARASGAKPSRTVRVTKGGR
jgi:hypothetical protein